MLQELYVLHRRALSSKIRENDKMKSNYYINFIKRFYNNTQKKLNGWVGAYDTIFELPQLCRPPAHQYVFVQRPTLSGRFFKTAEKKGKFKQNKKRERKSSTLDLRNNRAYPIKASLSAFEGKKKRKKIKRKKKERKGKRTRKIEKESNNKKKKKKKRPHQKF